MNIQTNEHIEVPDGRIGSKVHLLLYAFMLTKYFSVLLSLCDGILNLFFGLADSAK